MARTTFARSHRGRVEHVLSADNQRLTRCGLDAVPMAKFTAAERGQDAKFRPLCAGCRHTFNTEN
jgi:hypothetical protein